MALQREYLSRNHSKFLLKYHIILVCKYRRKALVGAVDFAKAHPAQHPRRVGLLHRGDGVGQRPCASACLCPSETIAPANRPAAEAGILSPHLAAARQHASTFLLERPRDILDQGLLRFQHRERQPGNYSKLYREPRLNLKKEAPFLHAAEDRVVSWREIL